MSRHHAGLYSPVPEPSALVQVGIALGGWFGRGQHEFDRPEGNQCGLPQLIAGGEAGDFCDVAHKKICLAHLLWFEVEGAGHCLLDEPLL